MDINTDSMIHLLPYHAIAVVNCYIIEHDPGRIRQSVQEIGKTKNTITQLINIGVYNNLRATNHPCPILAAVIRVTDFHKPF